MSADAYAFWKDALVGNPVTIHESEPRPGYYRMRRGKGQPWVPVGIWYPSADEPLVADVGGEEVLEMDRICAIWTYCCRYPITYELYDAVGNGAPWPEDVTAEVEAARAEIGHNSNAAPHEEIADEIAAATKAFETWLASIGGNITNEEDDAKSETFRTRLHALGKKAEDARTAEKRPIIEEGKRIDATWKPVVDAAETGKKRIGAVVVSYRVERDKRRRAEQERQEAERRAAAEEAARAAAAEAQARGEDPAVAAAEAVAAAAPAPRTGFVAEPKKGYRSVGVCIIDDPVKAATFILTTAPTQPDLLEVITKIAHRMLKAGVQVDGAHLTIEQRV